MENKKTELVFILDKSGSMSGREEDTIGGFNSMIDKQKQAEGKVFVTTILFSDHYQFLHDRKDLNEIAPLTRNDYYVGGCTALLDAIGNAITHIDDVHKNLEKEDVPEQTLFVITTDGYENASSEYTSTLVKKMIKQHQDEYKWEFIFLGANIDAVETASDLGIRRDRAFNYELDKTEKTWDDISFCCKCYCDTGNVIYNISIEDMDLSVHSYNCLKSANIHTVKDLTKMTESDLLKIRNCGRKTLDEVTLKLKNYGLSLKDDKE